MTTNEPQARPPLHRVTYWESDGFETFETGRALQLDTIAQMVKQMDETVMLAGGTALLGDIAALRSDLLALLVIYNAGGRLSIGPWYVQTDEWLVSGEALIRNLLMARADAVRYGIKLMLLGYAPNAPGHIAQLPQILRGFDIDSAFVAHGAPVPRMPFRWEAPDGSAVLAINHLPNLNNLADQQALEPDGPWLLMQPFGAKPTEAMHHTNTPLKAFVEALRKGMPDYVRPARRGELLTPDVQTGTLSSRIFLKQANARLQAQLNFAVEPWLAIALSDGTPSYPDNLRALLDHSWRMLLKNQAQNALGGVSSDAAHEEHVIRSKQIEDTSTHVMRESMRALFGDPYHAAASIEQTWIVVWNPHSWAVEQVVDVPVQPPPERYPARLVDSEGREKAFTWADGVLSFGADVPPVGYTSYTLHFSAQKSDDAVPTRTRNASITSALGDDKLLIENEHLIWRQVQPAVFDKEGQLVSAASERDLIRDVLRFFDGGDAGDAFAYRVPGADVVVQANLLPNVEVETSPLYQRLILHHRLRVTPALQPNRTRIRGLKSLDMVTTATFYHHTDQPGVYFQTTLENTVEDHRLRAHLRTGLKAETVWMDSPFALTQRRLVGIHPIHSVSAVETPAKVMALLARGLHEHEAVLEDEQVTLALTLVRAFGTAGSQCKGTLKADYALVSLPDSTGLLRAGQLYNAPLRAYVCEQRPAKPSQSYLTIDGGDNDDTVLLTALKPPQLGHGWIVRLLNPSAQPISAQLRTTRPIKSAQIVNLAEESHNLSALDIRDSNSVSVKLDPHKLVSVRVEF